MCNRRVINKANLMLVLCAQICAVTIVAQNKETAKPPVEQTDDVVRVYTELVQTDVSVLDKQGRFVDGLKREDFELRIDGKPVPLNFFERVQAGTSSEEAQWAAARGTSPLGARGGSIPLDRGRTIVFFVDDMHLSPVTLVQTRKLLQQFIDRDLKQNDEAQIVSASASVGFLQQLTDDKLVLQTAIERLTPRRFNGTDNQIPPMSAYQAFQIDRGDTDTLNYFIDELLKQNRLLPRAIAESEIRGRASALLQQASHAAKSTLSSLESTVRSSAKLPGRKLLFFISDGFFIDSQNSDSKDRIRAIVSAGARSGIVIYSIDARGLVADVTNDRVEVTPDATGRLTRGSQGEIFASQDPLTALAGDTGGRALLNTNDLYSAVKTGLSETSTYYLLGWRPERTEDNESRFRRLEVVVLGHPDLTPRVRRGFYDLDPVPPVTKSKQSKDPKSNDNAVEAELREAMISVYPERQIPIALSLNYLDTPEKGPSLSASMAIPTEFLTFDSEGGKGSAQVDLEGAVFDDRGQSNTRFGQQVTLTEALKSGGRKLTYTHTVYLKPGLYQVRVAARDSKTGKVGSTNSWIQVPDLSSNTFTLSSIVAGERRLTSPMSAISNGQLFSDQIPLSIDRRFRRNSFIRCLVFVYNSTHPANTAPDVSAQVQVLRDGLPVLTTPVVKIPTAGTQDPQHLPYATEIPLEGLPSGRYMLNFTAIDRLAKSSASQYLRFEIE